MHSARYGHCRAVLRSLECHQKFTCRKWLGTPLATALVGPFYARLSATKNLLVVNFWWRWPDAHSTCFQVARTISLPPVNYQGTQRIIEGLNLPLMQFPFNGITSYPLYRESLQGLRPSGLPSALR